MSVDAIFPFIWSLAGDHAVISAFFRADMTWSEGICYRCCCLCCLLLFLLRFIPHPLCSSPFPCLTLAFHGCVFVATFWSYGNENYNYTDSHLVPEREKESGKRLYTRTRRKASFQGKAFSSWGEHEIKFFFKSHWKAWELALIVHETMSNRLVKVIRRHNRKIPALTINLIRTTTFSSCFVLLALIFLIVFSFVFCFS